MRNSNDWYKITSQQVRGNTIDSIDLQRLKEEAVSCHFIEVLYSLLYARIIKMLFGTQNFLKKFPKDTGKMRFLLFISLFKCKENQRQFFIGVAKKLGIKSLEEYGKIKMKDVVENNGITLLNHYRGSLTAALHHIFPEARFVNSLKAKIRNFLNTRKHPGYWISKKNQRAYLEHLSTVFGIKKFEDWGKITRKQIKGSKYHWIMKLEYNGLGILNRYKQSVFSMLKANYPGTRNSNK